MKTKIAFALVISILFAMNASSTIAAAKNGCLVCHSSDATMKLLYKPPAAGPSEGEG